MNWSRRLGVLGGCAAVLRVNALILCHVKLLCGNNGLRKYRVAQWWWLSANGIRTNLDMMNYVDAVNLGVRSGDEGGMKVAQSRRR